MKLRLVKMPINGYEVYFDLFFYYNYAKIQSMSCSVVSYKNYF